MCLYRQLIPNPRYKPNKKNGGIIPPIHDTRVLVVPIGCGQCMECKRKKARDWQVRLLEDIRHNKTGKFVTLTFSNESIKELYTDEKIKHLKGYDLDNAAATLAVHRFRERWRKKYKKSIRHWLVTELGHSGTENIHLHGILYTNEIAAIEKIWKYGYVWAGYEKQDGKLSNYVSEKTVNYITKYVHKMDFDHRYYQSKVLTSAGIGGGYINRIDAQRNKYKKGETIESYKSRDGREVALPIYLRNKIYTDDERERLWIEKLESGTTWINKIKIDITENMDKYYKVLEQERKRNVKLGYGTNVKDWTKEKYEEQRRILKQNQRINNIKDTLPNGAKKELYNQWTKPTQGIPINNNFDEEIPTMLLQAGWTRPTAQLWPTSGGGAFTQMPPAVVFKE